MTVRESLVFKFGDFYSSDFGLYHINVDGGDGMFEEPFLPSRDIEEIQVRGRDKPFFQFFEREPLEFEVSFAFRNTFDRSIVNKIVRWLTPNYYERLVFSSEPTKVYYAMPVDDATIIHNGLRQGYVNLNFRCNAPYAFGSVRINEQQAIEEGEKRRINIKNIGDLPIYPELLMKNNYINGEEEQGRKIEIKNLTDHGKTLKFEEMKKTYEDEGSEITKYKFMPNGAKIYVNGEFEEVIGQNASGERELYYDFHNDNFIKLLPGINRLQLDGNFDVRFRWQPIKIS